MLDSYDRILAFIQKHLPDPFYLEGMERRSLRDAIFREVASNILIHREYASGVPARLIIKRGKVTTFNANRPHGFGLLDPKAVVPYPKNPVLGAFFREIDLADELGSGMRKMLLYGKKYGGADPQLIEGDVFRMVISVPEFDQPGYVSTASGSREQDDIGMGPSRDQEEILRNCLNGIGISELMQLADRTSRTKFRNQVIKPLLESGCLAMTIPDKPTSSKQKYRITEAGRKVLNI